MAKKQTQNKKKTPKPLPILRTWSVIHPSRTEEVLAHRVESWDHCLTFTIEQRVADDETEPVVVRGFAPGQWLEYRLVSEPGVTPAKAGA